MSNAETPNYGITVLDGERKEEQIPDLALCRVEARDNGTGVVDVEQRNYLYVDPDTLREVADAIERVTKR